MTPETEWVLYAEQQARARDLQADMYELQAQADELNPYRSADEKAADAAESRRLAESYRQMARMLRGIEEVWATPATCPAGGADPGGEAGHGVPPPPGSQEAP